MMVLSGFAAKICCGSRQEAPNVTLISHLGSFLSLPRLALFRHTLEATITLFLIVAATHAILAWFVPYGQNRFQNEFICT